MSAAEHPQGAPSPTVLRARRLRRREDYPDLAFARAYEVRARAEVERDRARRGRGPEAQQLEFPWSTWPAWTTRHTFGLGPAPTEGGRR
jgi:hypothetical protein